MQIAALWTIRHCTVLALQTSFVVPFQKKVDAVVNQRCSQEDKKTLSVSALFFLAK